MTIFNPTSRFSRLTASLGLAVLIGVSACDKGDSTTPPDTTADADTQPEEQAEVLAGIVKAQGGPDVTRIAR